MTTSPSGQQCLVQSLCFVICFFIKKPLAEGGGGGLLVGMIRIIRRSLFVEVLCLFQCSSESAPTSESYDPYS